jgi:hypothetical protein
MLRWVLHVDAPISEADRVEDAPGALKTDEAAG